MASDSITTRREYDTNNTNNNNNSRRRLGRWTSGMMNAMNAARRRHRRNNNNNNNSSSRSSGSSNNTRQRLLLVWNIWTLLGLCSYGLIWMIMMSDTQQHYEHVILRNQQQEVIQKALDLSRLERRLDHNNNKNNNNNKQRGHASSLRKSQPQQQQQQQTEGATLTKYDSASSTGGNDSSSSSQKQQQPQDDNDDFPFLGLWASMFILSYYRIRMEPHLRQYRSQQQRDLRRTGTAANLNASEQQEAVVRTLRRINQEREARGQESISLESYRAFQHVLMTDRSIWRVLAQRPQQAQAQQRRPVAATAEQLEACPIRTLERSEDDDCVISSADVDCTICLGSYETKDRIRTLPCRHEFHVDCIDRWMQQSVLCPICKASLAPEEEVVDNNNNNNNATNDINDNDNVVWAEIPGRMNTII